MKDIFADLYNRVLSFFNKSDEKTENAKDVACNRLKLVLMQDRTNLTPATMDRMRKELIDLLSKYLELDRELLDLSFEHEDEQMALMLSIPVIRAKSEEEIQAILDAEGVGVNNEGSDSTESEFNEEVNDEENDDSEFESDDEADDEEGDDVESESDDEVDDKEDDNTEEDDSDDDDDDTSDNEEKKEKFFKEKKEANKVKKGK